MHKNRFPESILLMASAWACEEKTTANTRVNKYIVRKSFCENISPRAQNHKNMSQMKNKSPNSTVCLIIEIWDEEENIDKISNNNMLPAWLFIIQINQIEFYTQIKQKI